MKRRNIPLISAITAALITVTCSVKEDRSGYPCTVSVRTQTPENCVVSFLDGTVLLGQKGIEADALCSGENRTSVRRCNLTVAAVSNCIGLEFSDSSIFCTPGKHFSPVEGFAAGADAHCEFLLVEGTLHKQHCSVTVTTNAGKSGMYPYRAIFKAPFNGLLLRTMEGTGSQFICDSVFDTDNSCSFILPRQNDNDGISMEMFDSEGLRIGKIDLGRYFLAAAYDWDAPDLDDISIIIDFSISTLTISVNDWKQHFILQYDI